MIKTVKDPDDKCRCSICGQEYIQKSIFYGKSHSHCPACHQLIGRLNTLYGKLEFDMQIRYIESIPVFIPLPRNGKIIDGTENTFMPKAITEQEAIEFLKGNNYKILKPTYIEI